MTGLSQSLTTPNGMPLKQNDELHLNLLQVYDDIKFWREIFILIGSTITFLGVLLNTACIIIFFKSKLFRNSSFPYYVYVISLVDTLNILIRFFIPQSIEAYVRYTLVTTFKVNPNEINTEKYDKYTANIASEYHCSLFIYFYNSLTLISVWLMAAVSLERWLVMKFALQTKYMIKLRACLILFFIFGSVFALNVFDLAPGLYIKPQWYANLTLLCERDDTLGHENDSARVHKRLGPLYFNTETFAFVRTLLQTIVPFAFVLFFNSLIIYNFKKIKLAVARKTKSTSCASVISAGSSLANSGSFKANLQVRGRRRWTHESHKSLNNNLLQPKRYIFKRQDLSSRSPSPLQTISIPNTPGTPTSLVAALSLAEDKCQSREPIRDLSPYHESSNKLFDNAFLMPPSVRNTSDSGTSSPNPTNSSANLSLATTTNLTNFTNLKSSSGGVELELGKSGAPVMKLTNERRSSKAKISRETDIMLIVLSFSILLSQLPCTVAWYLIYYCNILPEIASVYMSARTPIVLFFIRLLEMIYFSLNFFFYITLSPSLRKEIFHYPSKKSLNKLCKSLAFHNKYLACLESARKSQPIKSSSAHAKSLEEKSRANSDQEPELFNVCTHSNNKNKSQFFELVQKLERRPNNFKKNENDTKKTTKIVKKGLKLFPRKKRKESLTNANIQIIIDDPNEDEEVAENEPHWKFNCSSPAFFVSLNKDEVNLSRDEEAKSDESPKVHFTCS